MIQTAGESGVASDILFLLLEHYDFGFVSCFDIRISDLGWRFSDQESQRNRLN